MARDKNSPDKPRGKMSAYAYFIESCRAEEKAKAPVDKYASMAEFSTACSNRWKVISFPIIVVFALIGTLRYILVIFAHTYMHTFCLCLS